MTSSTNVPHRVLPSAQAWPLFNVEQTRALEAAALAERPAHELMASAGLAVARVVLATHPHARRVHALAGPGNNGGDALVAAARLRQCGLTVSVTLLASPDRLPADARHALAQVQQQGLPIATDLPADLRNAVVIDGVLGIGGTRPVQGALASAIRQLNASDAPVIAVDVPSGMDADRGTAVGETTVRATETVSMLTLKPGLFTAHGRDHAGRVWFDALGVDHPPSSMRLIGPTPSPVPVHASHKGSFGDVCVIGGAAGMGGATLLAARAALAAGAGRVYLCVLDAEGSTGVAAAHAELMQRSLRDTLKPDALTHQTVVCGCGGGDAMRAVLPPVLAHSARLVLDADALNAIAAEPALADALKHRAARGRATVMTPHPLEAARLLGVTVQDVQADRLKAARTLAQRWTCVVVLKGSGTLVAAPNGDIGINPTGNARLASPGSGDVLAGWIGGAWARCFGTGGQANDDGAHVAAAAVWRHGRAADEAAGPHLPNLRAGELIEAMRQAQCC